MNLKEWIRSIPDFPREGIDFKDITPLLREPEALRRAIKEMACPFVPAEVDIVAGPEARGFLFGMPLAYELGAGFVPVRKKGKLPSETIQGKYELEYGYDILEMHKDAIKPGQKVLIADDLLATGGTALATAKMVQDLGGKVVGISFLVELTFLAGREQLKDYRIHSLIQY